MSTPVRLLLLLCLVYGGLLAWDVRLVEIGLVRGVLGALMFGLVVNIARTWTQESAHE